MRNRRNSLLAASDWTQMGDAPLTEIEKEQWRTYRQSLRDVPVNNASATTLAAINWPEEP